ncbi:MAG: PLP-dependent aminotransferase family protein [Nocardioides sp.]
MYPTTHRVSPSRLAHLVEGFGRHPAYAGLAEALRTAISDGRIPHGTRLPSERVVTDALGVSRTTVTRAYSVLREQGYAEARRGAGTFARIPGGGTRSLDRVLSPGTDNETLIDLNCAACPAAPGVTAAYEAAIAELPAYLSSHGYYPAGLPELQLAIARRFDERGLPTEPDQIMITPGSLAATAVVARALVRNGDHVMVESPVYPNALHTFASAGARLAPVPVSDDGWDLELVTSLLSRRVTAAAYLIPDFQNPTGHLMPDPARVTLAEPLAASSTIAIVDEAHQELMLDGSIPPRPMAACIEAAGGEAITVGSISKSVWGGLRVGWLRAPLTRLDALTQARLTLDLGVPVMEQLCLTHLLDDRELLDRHRHRLRSQRSTLVAAVRDQLPDWRFVVPSGGLALWCELPTPSAVTLSTEAERHGVAIAPGPVFAPEGGFANRVRIPWARTDDELKEAVRRLATAWAVVRDTALSGPPPGRRPMVA